MSSSSLRQFLNVGGYNTRQPCRTSLGYAKHCEQENRTCRETLFSGRKSKPSGRTICTLKCSLARSRFKGTPLFVAILFSHHHPHTHTLEIHSTVGSLQRVLLGNLQPHQPATPLSELCTFQLAQRTTSTNKKPP